jgi:hypothetical protein
MQTFLPTFFFFIIFAITGFSQSSTESKIEETVEKYIDQSGFSGTILVAEKGQPLFHKSFGIAYHHTPDSIENNYH